MTDELHDDELVITQVEEYVCRCGTTVPARPGEAFEAGCRHCERSALNRMLRDVV